MTAQPGEPFGGKNNKRPAEAVLTSANTKNLKTTEVKGSQGTKLVVRPQKPALGRKEAQSNQGHQAPQVRDRGMANQGTKHGKRPAPWEVRSIAAQPSDAALKDGELDVQAFLNARGFEIKALDESMRRTRVTKTSRAFQRVPFVLRRRAAAHNHKRVPKRLHRRARKEMEQDSTPSVNARSRKPKTNKSRVRSHLRANTALRLGKLAERKKRQKLNKKGKDGKVDDATIQTRVARPKIKRNATNEPVITASKFRKRQLNKTWLPTHLWHAKRATMTPPLGPMWRFAIPLTPQQKCYRPTHRTLREKGAMAWDMSYMSTISLFGAVRSVVQLLQAIGLTADSLWDDRADKWRSGAFHWNGTLTRNMENTTRAIGPATILWNPEVQEDDTPMDDAAKKTQRRLFIRLHPSIFLETFTELIRLAKGLTPRPHVEDLRYEIGSIEVTGPDATEALLGVLKPYRHKSESQNSHGTKWESLAGITPSGLPIGSILAFSISDPRLRYPPRRVDVPDASDRPPQTSTSWHRDLSKAPMALFDRDARFRATQLPSLKSLNRRKSKLSPGALLEPTRTDPEIPVILLASRESDGPGKWTVLMPWKCIMFTWYALMHFPLSSGGTPSFGGLQEMQQGAFEQGLPWFPGDFPATDAGIVWELEQREARKKAWDRMPRGKRVNYNTLDLGAGRKGEVGKGWSCDYEALLGLESPTVNAQKPDVVMAGQGDEPIAPTHGEGQNRAALSKHPLAQVVHFSRAQLNTHLSAKLIVAPPTGLVAVKIKVLGRGVLGPCARIYSLPVAKPISAATQAEVPATNPPLAKSGSLPPDIREQWLATLPQQGRKISAKQTVKHNSSSSLGLETRKRLLAQELIAAPQTESAGLNGHPPCPDAEDRIGFVTTGCFNLKEGHAEAIASISVEKALEELRRYKNKEDRSTRLCIVRNSGQSIGWLARWELI